MPSDNRGDLTVLAARIMKQTKYRLYIYNPSNIQLSSTTVNSYNHQFLRESRIRETKHLSTDVDSSTDTTVGWTKIPKKPKFFEKQKKSSKLRKLKNV